MNGQTGEGVQGYVPLDGTYHRCRITILTNTTGNTKGALISAGWFDSLFVAIDMISMASLKP